MTVNGTTTTKLVIALVVAGFVGTFGFLLREDRESIRADAETALIEARAANSSVVEIKVNIENMAEDIKEIKDLLKKERD